MKICISLAITLFVLINNSFAQQNDTWENWSWLIGEWKGEGKGQPGQGGGAFSFYSELDNKVIVRKSHSEYPALDNKPAVIHDDLMIVYPDFSGIPSKAIYFDNEGHIIDYSLTYPDSAIVFTSNRIADIPVFRLTYELLEEGKVNTKFEMSQDGEKFTTYIEGISIKRICPGIE